MKCEFCKKRKVKYVTFGNEHRFAICSKCAIFEKLSGFEVLKIKEYGESNKSRNYHSFQYTLESGFANSMWVHQAKFVKQEMDSRQ